MEYQTRRTEWTHELITKEIILNLIVEGLASGTVVKILAIRYSLENDTRGVKLSMLFDHRMLLSHQNDMSIKKVNALGNIFLIATRKQLLIRIIKND